MLILSHPAIFALELTSACHHRCIGCSNVFPMRDVRVLDACQWQSLLSHIIPGAVQIRLTGGEPTLHPEFFEILDYAADSDALVAVFTNGRWAAPLDFVRRVKRHDNASLLVSLHGARPESHGAFTRAPGTFAEIVANIRLAVQHGLRVTLSCVVTRYNWQEIEQVAALTTDLGADLVTFPRYMGKPLPEVELTPTQLREVTQRIEALIANNTLVQHSTCLPQCLAPNDSEGCHAGVAYVAVDPQGNLRPCTFSPTVIGSLFEHSLHDLWHSVAMDAWRDLMPVECISCAAYALCHGGCRAMIELRPERRDPLRGEPLSEYIAPPRNRQLPANAKPQRHFRIRQESFGYALLGVGQVVPVAAAALPVLEACDGTASFAQIGELFGQPALDLLGELWERGMLIPAR